MVKPFTKANFKSRRQSAAIRVQKAVRRKAALKRAVSRKPIATIAKNARTIALLNKKVIAAANGHYQENFQNVVNVAGFYTLAPSRPFAFCMEDFTSLTAANTAGGPIFGATYSGVSPNIMLAPAVIGQWQSVNPGNNFGLDLRYRQWADNNNDTASLTAYQPISATYNLTFNRSAQIATQTDSYVRVDIISTKRRYLNTVHHQYNMPDCLGAFQEMAISNANGQRNKYNPALWKVETRWLKIPGNKTGVSVNDVSRTMRLYKSFDRKLIKLDLDYQASTTSYEQFHMAVDPARVHWCVISASDDPVANEAHLTTKFTRTIRYRDQHGVGM